MRRINPTPLIAHSMGYTIGLVLSPAVFAMAIAVGLGRSFYSTLMIMNASYYVLSAALGGSGRTLILESPVARGFLLPAAIGFRKNHWFVVEALVRHGLFDLARHHVIDDPGVPRWSDL
jgi:hypothetical protein